MQRIIREVDPPKPSTRLGQQPPRRSRPSRRSAETSPRAPRLDRPRRARLDRDEGAREGPQRRYETANGLAMDIQRYLVGEAVVAAPPGAAYRAGKFIRRHRGGVLAASAVAAALVVGAVAFAWQARVARGQRDRAVAAEAEARTTRAEELEGLRLPGGDARPGPAVETIETQFEDQPVVDAQLRQVLAVQYGTLVLYDKAMPLQERALATRRQVVGEEHPDTLYSISQMGILLQGMGKLDEAEPYYREALEKRRRVLGDEHPDTLTSISNMDFLLQGQGKLAEAEPFAREALEIRRRVLGDQDPHTLLSISNMCTVIMFQGRLDEAEPYCREALQKRRQFMGDDHGDTVVSINILAYMLEMQGKLDEAMPLRYEAVEKSRRVLGEEHPDTQVAVSNMGYLLKKLGRVDEAEPYYREAFETFTRVLGEAHPYSLSTVSNLGSVYVAQGRYAEAIDLLAPAEPAMRATFTGDNARVLARFLLSLGSARAGLGFREDRFAAAEANLLEAHELFVATRGEEHEDTRESVQALAGFYDAWARAMPGRGHDAQAAKWKTGE
jgi:eukaryotic-like serine/threonine-protein kinase